MLIVTDGAVDVPEGLLRSPMLRRVPGEIWTGEAPFTGTPDEFWTALRRGTYPSTTPPTVSALTEAYHDPHLVIGMHVSSRLSATFARASEAASRRGSGVVVVDTGSLSAGAGLLVTAVHRTALSEHPPDSLVDFARSLPARLHTFGVIQDVEALRKSDRSGLLPSEHLDRRHPLVLAVRGRAVPLGQPKHREGALRELCGHLRRAVGPAPGAWALGHGDATDVDTAVEELGQALDGPPAFCTMLDPTVGAHMGPDALVVGAISGPVDL